MAEVPDRAVDQLFQRGRQVVFGFLASNGMVEDVEDVQQLAVIVIDLIDTDTEYVVSNQIFQNLEAVAISAASDGASQ